MWDAVAVSVHLVTSLSLVYLIYSSADDSGSYSTRSWLERVVVAGISSPPTSIRISSGVLPTSTAIGLCLTPDLYYPGGTGSEDLMFTHEADTRLLIIRRPGVNMAQDFTISIR